MDDSELIDLLGGTGEVARMVGTTSASVSEWRINGIPRGRKIELAAALEKAGGPKRYELFSKDWPRIWPELIGADGAPPVPSTEAA